MKKILLGSVGVAAFFGMGAAAWAQCATGNCPQPQIENYTYQETVPEQKWFVPAHTQTVPAYKVSGQPTGQLVSNCPYSSGYGAGYGNGIGGVGGVGGIGSGEFAAAATTPTAGGVAGAPTLYGASNTGIGSGYLLNRVLSGQAGYGMPVGIARSGAPRVR